MNKKLPDLDRGEDGKPLPTLRNREIFEALEEELGGKEVLKRYERDYSDYAQKVTFDPRKPNVFFRTEEQAQAANKYSDMLNEMDLDYIDSRKTAKDPYYKANKERLAKMSDKEFVAEFNKGVNNKEWSSSHAIYLSLIYDELNKRKFDYSAISLDGGFKFDKKIKLEGKKITAL